MLKMWKTFKKRKKCNFLGFKGYCIVMTVNRNLHGDFLEKYSFSIKKATITNTKIPKNGKI